MVVRPPVRVLSSVVLSCLRKPSNPNNPSKPSHAQFLAVLLSVLAPAGSLIELPAELPEPELPEEPLLLWAISGELSAVSAKARLARDFFADLEDNNVFIPKGNAVGQGRICILRWAVCLGCIGSIPPRREREHLQSRGWVVRRN
ncbi:MAG: hypothetical protein JWO95_1769 [Verrucomicrobiales bacterium]|nr:hypothetical protein [Verrucomicrobiales bacterium]